MLLVFPNPQKITISNWKSFCKSPTAHLDRDNDRMGKKTRIFLFIRILKDAKTSNIIWSFFQFRECLRKTKIKKIVFPLNLICPAVNAAACTEKIGFKLFCVMVRYTNFHSQINFNRKLHRRKINTQKNKVCIKFECLNLESEWKFSINFKCRVSRTRVSFSLSLY